MRTHYYRTREEWLNAAVNVFRPWFDGEGSKLPDKLRVTCGFPSGSPRIVIGECWIPEVSNDHTTEIFINPTQGDPARVLDVLLHELVHASGIRGHGKDFRGLAVAVGLGGKMTATIATADLKTVLRDIIEKDLGPYPHAALSLGFNLPGVPGGGPEPRMGRPADRPKQQTARLIKCGCEQCGYTARITRKWIEVGLPECVCGGGVWVVQDKAK